MRINYHDLIHRLDRLESNLGNLCTLSEGVVDWHQVPNQDLVIVHERIKVIELALNDLFNHFESFEER